MVWNLKLGGLLSTDWSKYWLQFANAEFALRNTSWYLEHSHFGQDKLLQHNATYHFTGGATVTNVPFLVAKESRTCVLDRKFAVGSQGGRRITSKWLQRASLKSVVLRDSWFQLISKQFERRTVDGRNPAPPGMYKTSYIMSIMWDLPYSINWLAAFFHQPYDLQNATLLNHIPDNLPPVGPPNGCFFAWPLGGMTSTEARTVGWDSTHLWRKNIWKYIWSRRMCWFCVNLCLEKKWHKTT